MSTGVSVSSSSSSSSGSMHIGDGARVSAMTTHELRVSPHRRCALHLLVLNRTSGGAHKFKVERLLVEDVLQEPAQ